MTALMATQDQQAPLEQPAPMVRLEPKVQWECQEQTVPMANQVHRGHRDPQAQMEQLALKGRWGLRARTALTALMGRLAHPVRLDRRERREPMVLRVRRAR